MMTKVLAVAAMVALGAPVRADGDAAKLLARADGFRGGFDSGIVEVKLTNYDVDRVVEEAGFEVSVKGENSLVRFLSVRSKGQSLLMRGDDMWLFLPAVARPVRITPIQRLLGNVSNGDLARLRYAIDYEATIEGEENVAGVACTVLDLRATRTGATYQRVRYVVRKDDARPVRAEYFLTSGKAIKTAVFGGLREMGGRPTLTRIDIHDALHPASRTTIEFLKLTPRTLPDKLFSPVRAEG
jgi:outer membrane lipoprotein-sorting protein